MNAIRHFFTERIACIWNGLKLFIIDFRSLSSFKKTISYVHVNLFTRLFLFVIVFFFLSIAICASVSVSVIFYVIC